TTAPISFDTRGDGATDGPDADSLTRDQELDALATAIANAINAEVPAGNQVTVQHVRSTFFLEFADTAAGAPVAVLSVDSSSAGLRLTANDVVGTAQAFINHSVTLVDPGQKDSVVQKFVAGRVPDQRDGKATVTVNTEGSASANEVQ